MITILKIATGVWFVLVTIGMVVIPVGVAFEDHPMTADRLILVLMIWLTEATAVGAIAMLFKAINSWFDRPERLA